MVINCYNAEIWFKQSRALYIALCQLFSATFVLSNGFNVNQTEDISG